MTLDQSELSKTKVAAQEVGGQEPQKLQQKPASGMGLLAEVTTLSWNLVIPIVGGILLGHYLDNRSGNRITWTLSLLVLGVIIAFSNLYNLYMERGQQELVPEQNNSSNQVTHDQKE